MVQQQDQTFGNVFEFLQLNKKHKSQEDKISAQKIAYKNTTTSGNPLTKWKSQLTDTELRLLNSFIDANSKEMELLNENIQMLSKQ